MDQATGTAKTADTLLRIREGTEHFDRKIFVVVDSMTLSTAELLAAWIGEECDNAIVIGTRTFGKATAQVVVRGPDSGMARITYAACRTPAGQSWEKKGVMPDVLVGSGEEAYSKALSEAGCALAKRRRPSSLALREWY
jgi:carboxyl-terminal processing protease